MPVDRIMSAYFAVNRRMNVDQMTMGFSPTVDLEVLPQHPFHPAASSVSADVPVMLGSTRTELTNGAAEAMFSMQESEMQSRVRELSEEDLLRDRDLADADPELLSVLNVNEPSDYERARARAAPSVTVRRFGTLAAGLGREPLAVRAATLQAAATAAGLALDRHVVAALNGDQISRDPELPLAAGDAVAFLSADVGG